MRNQRDAVSKWRRYSDRSTSGDACERCAQWTGYCRPERTWGKIPFVSMMKRMIWKCAFCHLNTSGSRVCRTWRYMRTKRSNSRAEIGGRYWDYRHSISWEIESYSVPDQCKTKNWWLSIYYPDSQPMSSWTPMKNPYSWGCSGSHSRSFAGEMIGGRIFKTHRTYESFDTYARYVSFGCSDSRLYRYS